MYLKLGLEHDGDIHLFVRLCVCSFVRLSRETRAASSARDATVALCIGQCCLSVTHMCPGETAEFVGNQTFRSCAKKNRKTFAVFLTCVVG